jgi:hypothetical protein
MWSLLETVIILLVSSGAGISCLTGRLPASQGIHSWNFALLLFLPAALGRKQKSNISGEKSATGAQG